MSFRLDLEQVFDTKEEARKAHPCVKAGSRGLMDLECVYTPDFLVELVSPVPLIVESKSDDEIQKRQADMERRKKILSTLGYRFLLVPNSEFNAKGFHQNMVDIRDALNSLKKHDCRLRLESLDRLIEPRSEPFELGEIWDEVQPISEIHLAVASGRLAYDLRGGKLSRFTTLWPANGELTHLQILKLEN